MNHSPNIVQTPNLPAPVRLPAWSCAVALFMGAAASTLGQGTQPVVAVHDSELTRALQTMPAVAPTPTGAGTTGFQWWTSDWNYFVMPDSVKEALRSDGTAFTVVGDSNITAGLLLPNGTPKYPIVISLTSEAIRNDEIAPLTNYVAAGGFLFVSGSSFTRNPDGTSRGDFALASQFGIHMASASLTNWTYNSTFTKQSNHRIISHVPGGTLTWRLPMDSEEINWGISPNHPFLAPHDLWQVQASDATVLAWGDTYPYLLVKPYGKGYFIYDAAMQPLVGHGGFAPGMYSYAILRKSIEWAFESARLPVPKLSPWPFAYDAAMIVRHDLEDFQSEIADVEASAGVEFTNHVKGDYYFCTGTLRQDMAPAGYDTNAVIASLRRAMMNYGATIGPHNGGLKNPDNSALQETDYDFWHWGPDEALDVAPAGYASGKAYAQASLAASFQDIESWLPGLMTTNLRVWVAPNFNATREDSYDLQSQVGVKISGDQKLSPFPHWTVSTRTADKLYPMLSEPVSDWFVGGLVAQSLEPWHPPGVETSATMHAGVDFYYGLGALVNFYSHTLATGEGDAGPLTPDYITYCMNTNLHPRLWAANAIGIYQWWLQRSNAVVTASCVTNGDTTTTTLAVHGAKDPTTAVEFVVPTNGTIQNLKVLANGIAASTNNYRFNGQTLKLLVGTTITNAQVSYTLSPAAQNDLYNVQQGSPLNVPTPGVLANDSPGGGGGALKAVLTGGTAHGTLSLSTNGSFTYTPAAGFSGTDSFTYAANDGVTNSASAVVILSVNPPGVLFSDNFTASTNPAPIWPWVAQQGNWMVSGGQLQGNTTADSYGNAYYDNSAWTDYTVQGQVQFSTTSALGGGLGGRLNAGSGAHYAAWVYPELSAGGSAELKLVKFEGWTSWSGTPMQTASLGSVGTNLHTLAMTFTGTNITVSYDGAQVINVTDNNFDSVAPFTNGGISADMYADTTLYTLGVDNVIVTTTATNTPPPTVANNDSYSVNEGSSLTVAAPGVLANDTGGTLTATLVSGVTHGTLSFNANGSFIYTPAGGFAGTDSFTYTASNGTTTSSPATVTITVSASGLLFSDDFTRSTDPGPLTPWTAQDGTWTVTDGQLLGQSAASTYGNAYYQNAAWTNYTVQGQVAFTSISAWGGGLGGRLNPATGAHYAAWIYPDESGGGSAVLKLVKFEGWTSWSGTPMQTASLGSVGTNLHTLAVTFQGTVIAVSFDGVQKISVTDNDFDSVAPYASGGITADLWTDANGYTMSVDNVTVTGTVAVAPPVIATQPQSLTLNAGTKASFTVAATGIAPLTYQWTKNGTNLANGGNVSGVATTNLVLTNVSAADAAAYAVIVSNPGGSVTSSPASLTVIGAPLIVTQPASQTNNAGTTASFAVSATGTSLTYQWRFNGTNIAGANAGNYSRTNVQAANAGNYTVVVTNSAGSVTSSAAVLTVITAPVIVTQPASRTNNAGTTASFTVSATGTSLTYQWRFNGTNIAGATAANYSRTNVQAANAGSYTVVVTNSAGSVTSSAAALTVIAPPSITTQPQSQTILAGQSVTFSVTAAGTGTLAYQWRFNGANISGATSSNYTKANVQAANAGNYTVVVTNSAGSITSSIAVLTVTTPTPPSITAQPQSLTVIAGQNATFSVTAAGTGPLTYQWSFNGVNISGATNSTYTRTATVSSNAGSYTVVVKNAVGSVTSSKAVLTVDYSLTLTATTGGSIIALPSQASYAPGASVILIAEPATGYSFTGWTGSATGTQTFLSITMNANMAITANFKANAVGQVVTGL